MITDEVARTGFGENALCIPKWNFLGVQEQISVIVVLLYLAFGVFSKVEICVYDEIVDVLCFLWHHRKIYS